MEDFILRYWVQALFMAVTTFFAWLMRRLFKKVKSELAEQALIKDGVLAILHDRIYERCSVCIKDGWCSLEERRNLEYMYTSYHRLGGNGTGTDIYMKVCALPMCAPMTSSRKDGSNGNIDS